MSRFLHVANGTSTTMTIEAAGIPGLRSLWADPLFGGPVPDGLSDAELIDVRARHLAAHPDALDPANDLRAWRTTIERYETYDELLLWFEHDLFDQLNLIQLLTWLHGRLPRGRLVTLICIGAFPGRPDFKGLGELTPEELATLLETRQPVTPAQYTLAERTWAAFRQPTPEALDAIRHEDTSALPFLAGSIARFLQEYPWTGDGLSRTERRFLELADEDGISVWQAFLRMSEGERAYHVTDLTLIDLVDTLSRTSPPLITVDRPQGAASDSLSGVSVARTSAARALLAGEIDRVTAFGLDRWLGGVHLTSGRAMWRWDPARDRVVRT